MRLEQLECQRPWRLCVLLCKLSRSFYGCYIPFLLAVPSTLTTNFEMSMLHILKYIPGCISNPDTFLIITWFLHNDKKTNRMEIPVICYCSFTSPEGIKFILMQNNFKFDIVLTNVLKKCFLVMWISFHFYF